MSDPVTLEVTVSDLRTRMAQAGCVFEFTVQCLPSDVEVSHADHRHALELLFQALSQQFRQQRLDSIARDPSLETWRFFTLEFHTTLATGALIDALEVSADGSSWLQRLGADFLEWGKRPDDALFAAFCAVVGFGPDAVVMDWVGDEDAQPDGSAWSNYFDEGDCFGKWCATIWNPATRTLGQISDWLTVFVNQSRVTRVETRALCTRWEQIAQRQFVDNLCAKRPIGHCRQSGLGCNQEPRATDEVGHVNRALG